MKTLLSKLQLLNIELQRGFDHSWRRIFGLPTLRRSKITPQIFIGGQHSSIGINGLRKLGITAVVNMRMRSFYQKALFEQKVNYLHLPTPDLTAPTLEDLISGVAFIKAELEKSGKVYIHCKHGEGRGPTMALAYLISTGLTYDDAYALVKKVRVFIRPTLDQITRLKEFEVYINKQKS